MRLVAVIFLLSVTPSLAQPVQYAPPDKELWETMVRALSDVPMSLGSHRAVQQVLAEVQREAARAKVPERKPESSTKQE